MINEQVPHIWTSKGHLVEADLRADVVWTRVEGGLIKVAIRHYLGDELVKESCHGVDLRCLPVGNELGTFS